MIKIIFLATYIFTCSTIHFTCPKTMFTHPTDR